MTMARAATAVQGRSLVGALVTGAARIAELRHEWERVWHADPSADLFASFNWFENVCETLGRTASAAAIVYHDGVGLAAIPGGEWLPRVCVVRDPSGGLLAILPLVELNGRFENRSHRLLSTPINPQAPRSGIAATCFDESVVRAMAAALRVERRWTLLILGGLPVSDGRAQRLAKELARSGLPCLANTSWPSSYLRFDRSLDDYFGGSERAHFRRSIVKATNALAKRGTPLAECFGADHWHGGLEIFLQIDEASWKAESGESIRPNAGLVSYYTGLCRRLADSGQLEIWVLRVGETPAAAFICPHDGRSRYTLKSSFSQAFGAGTSPTLVLLHELVRKTWAVEASGIDFVGKVAFLERWATEDLSFQTSQFVRSPFALWHLRASREMHEALARIREGSVETLARLRRRAAATCGLSVKRKQSPCSANRR